MINNVSPSGVLDIGSYQSKCIIFRITNSRIEILSKVILKTEGIKKGFVTDLKKLSDLINKLIGKAEDIANLQINTIYLSISPINYSSVYFCNSKNIGSYQVEHEKDVQFLINDSVNLFKDSYSGSDIVHLFNLNFRTDKINYIENPLGLVADSFESDSHIIFSKKNILKNFTNIFSANNLKLEKFIYSPFALALSIHEESPLSDANIVIDFGHEHTSLSIFENDNFIFAASIPLGSLHITNDVAKSLNLNFDIAESLKINHSSCEILSGKILHEYVESENFGTRSYKKVSNNILNQVVRSRVDEIIDFINKELLYFRTYKKNFNKIILTGEGSKIKGLEQVLKAQLIVTALVIEKFTPKIKNGLGDEFDVCFSMINYIKNPYFAEIPSYKSSKQGLFEKLYSLFN